MSEQNKLSEKTKAVLSLIAEGHSYSQIVDGHSGVSYLDIFNAAEEALRLSETTSDYKTRIKEIKVKFPRAYEPWSNEDDAELLLLYSDGDGQSIVELATHFQRQPSAIRSRLNKLGLYSIDRN